MNHFSSNRVTRLLLAITVGGFVFLTPASSEAQARQKVIIFEGDPENAKTWQFKPQELTIPAGTTVVFEWQADDEHSATADDGSWDSGTKRGRGTTWEHRFATPGEYPYSCIPHPYMYGQINVTG